MTSSTDRRIHTNEMQDIITKPPVWLLRWGITMVLVILSLVFGMSALIRYPDIINAQLKIYSIKAMTPSTNTIRKVDTSVKEGQYYGLINLPQDRMSKVKLGQKVLIKLESYPFGEYGMITGEIKAISDIANQDGSYLYSVEIKKDGYSNLSKDVQLKSGMNASAEIITEDTSLLTRICRNITKNGKLKDINKDKL